MGLASVLAPSLIGGACAIIGAVVGASDLPAGWAKSVLCMTELYDRLPADGRSSATEALARKLLRDEIYGRVYRGLGYRLEGNVPVPREQPLPAVLDAVSQNAGAFLVTWGILGLPETFGEWVVRICALALGWVAVYVGEAFLRRWPAKEWNPAYKAERRRLERRKMVKARIEQELEKLDLSIAQSDANTEEVSR